MHKQEKGWIGVLCGSRSEKPGNVAFLVIVLAFVLIIVALVRIGLTPDFFKLAAACASLITLSLGYLFGAKH
jgi:hypothetical protein